MDADLRRIDQAQARYAALRDQGRILPNSLEALRVELTYHSNAIEGNTLTLRETQLILEGRTPDAGKPLREIYEARNHDRALRQIEQWAAQRPAHALLTERDILEVHALVLADIDSSHAGRFRRDRVLIKGTRYIPPSSAKLDALLPATLSLATTPSTHPVLRAAEFHYNLVAIHPFQDGNGRAARLLMNYLLLRCGYPSAIITVERRGEYLSSLEEANVGRTQAFARFIASCVQHTLDRLVIDA